MFCDRSPITLADCDLGENPGKEMQNDENCNNTPNLRHSAAFDVQRRKSFFHLKRKQYFGVIAVGPIHKGSEKVAN